MKRILSIVMASMLFFCVSAQVNVSRTQANNPGDPMPRKSSQLAIKYGVKAGVNFSTMSNDMEFNPDFGMGTGFRIGGLVNFHWGQRTSNSLPGTGWIGLQPEIIYSYQSVKTADKNLNMNYIQVPVMLKIYPVAALSIELGPEFSYLLSTSPDVLYVDGATVKLGDLNGFNMGAGIGAAYEFGMGLTFGARYSLGFTDIAKSLKWKNDGNIQITAGWLF